MGQNTNRKTFKREDVRPSIEEEVIDQAYQAILNPELYVVFEKTWDKYICSITENYTNLQDTVRLESAFVSRNISRALELSQRVQVKKSSNSHAEYIVENISGFGMLLTRSGDIVASNAKAKLVANDQRNFRDLDLNQEDIAGILGWMREDISNSQDKFFFTDVQFGTQQDKMCLLVAPIDVDTERVSVNHSNYLVTSVDFQLNPKTVSLVMRRFELTQAESEIAIQLSNGFSSREISTQRGVSKVRWS